MTVAFGMTTPSVKMKPVVATPMPNAIKKIVRRAITESAYKMQSRR